MLIVTLPKPMHFGLCMPSYVLCVLVRISQSPKPIAAFPLFRLFTADSLDRLHECTYYTSIEQFISTLDWLNT